MRRVFYGIENTHERAERSIQPDIRFMLRTVPQEKLPSLSARACPAVRKILLHKIEKRASGEEAINMDDSRGKRYNSG